MSTENTSTCTSAIEQIAAVLPYGEAVLHRAEEVKERGLEVYATTRGKLVETRKEYLSFKKGVRELVHNVAEETVNELFNRMETLFKIQKDEKIPEDLQHSRQRLQSLLLSIYKTHIQSSIILTNPLSKSLLSSSKTLTQNTLVPLYINVKATLLVTKQMMLEFLESLIGQVKMTYTSSKDHVVMFVSGQVSEDVLRKKVLGGIECFKEFTVRAVNRGLEIRVDRKSLVENYDLFAVKLLEIVKEVREKGEENITQIKKRSKDLYKEVVSRIRAKELEIRTNLRTAYPQLEAPVVVEKSQ